MRRDVERDRLAADGKGESHAQWMKKRERLTTWRPRLRKCPRGVRLECCCCHEIFSSEVWVVSLVPNDRIAGERYVCYGCLPNTLVTHRLKIEGELPKLVDLLNLIEQADRLYDERMKSEHSKL